MSDHNLAEALRQIINQAKWGTLGRCEQLAREALAAHEAEQQAGEAVAVVYSISGQSQTEDAYATVQVLNSAGKGCWVLPVRAGTNLFTHPQKSLTREQIGKVSADAHIAFCLDKYPTYEEALTRAIEAELGITK